MVDAKRLAEMKPKAVLVNTARGGIIDEAALYEALRTGEIGAAGLDATEVEPACGQPPGNTAQLHPDASCRCCYL